MNEFRASSAILIACLWIIFGCTHCAHHSNVFIQETTQHEISAPDTSAAGKSSSLQEIQIDYYRDGEVVQTELGSVTKNPEGEGLILIRSPQPDNNIRRSYRFDAEKITARNTHDMRMLTGQILLRGWSVGTIRHKDSDVILINAYPSHLDKSQIGYEPDDEGEWVDITLTFIEMFFQILELLLYIVAS